MVQDIALKSNRNLKDNVFFVAYVLLFLNEMVSTYTNLSDLFGSMTSTISVAIYICFLAVCAVCFLLQKTFQLKELLAVICAVILGAVSYYFSDSHTFLDFMLIMCIAKDIDFEKFVKRVVIFTGVFILIIIGLSACGIISSITKEARLNERVRNSYGFNHPNSLGILIFQFIAGVVLLERNKLRVISFVLLFALGVLFYILTGSLSSFVSICILLFAVFIYSAVINRAMTANQAKRLIIVVLAIVTILLVIAIIYFWSNPGQLAFSTLGSRIRQARKYLNAYGVNLFGQEILSGTNVALPGYYAGYSYLDNSQVWYLVKFGIVGFILFFYLYFRMVKYTLDNKEFVLCIIAVVYLIYSLTENSPCRVSLNFMLVYAAWSFYKTRGLTRKVRIVAQR